MAVKIFRQESIEGGISSTYFGDTKRGQYRLGLGIDPDLSLENKYRMSNAVYPTAYQKFSSTEIDDAPIAFIAPRTGTERVYSIQKNGKVVYYDSALSNAVSVGQITGNVANGAWEQNNYIYIPSGTNVSRVGPLSGAVAITNTWWTATAGLAGLTNTTYPTIRSISLHNHWGVQHVDGAAYFVDFASNQGIIHRLKTDSSGANAGSAYNVLDLPFGYYPTCIESYGNLIAIGAIQTVQTTLRQGEATLFLWDTIAESFYDPVPLADVFVTGLKNSNGRLFIFTGSANGNRVSVFAGGQSTEQVAFFDDGVTPLAGAIDSYGDRIVFGAYTSFPSSAAVVLSFGSKQSGVPSSFHCPVKTTSGDSGTPTTTAVKYVQQQSGSAPRIIAGWKTASAQGIDKYGLVYNNNTPYFRTDIFEVGRKFKVRRLRFNTSQATSSGVQEILPRILVDEEGTTHTLSGRNSTQAFVYKRPEIGTIVGNKNFCVNFEWYGSGGELALELPIEIEVETYGDQS